LAEVAKSNKAEVIKNLHAECDEETQQQAEAEIVDQRLTATIWKLQAAITAVQKQQAEVNASGYL
jgi:hypothetical protein